MSSPPYTFIGSSLNHSAVLKVLVAMQSQDLNELTTIIL